MCAAVEVRARRRRWLCPQVVQTSQMDCGPAAAKALLEGCGLPASYGRLREVCQTDVDGTAIGDLETLISRLGLPVEEVMVPLDHVLITERQLPSIAVVEGAAGQTHFVVAWRRHGRWLQVMDPAAGRRFVALRDFEQRLYSHQHEVEAAAWREWAATDDFIAPLSRRLERLGADASRLVGDALEDRGWRPLAALDAATRMATVLLEAGALPRRGVDDFVGSLAGRAATEITSGPTAASIPASIPERFWSVWPTGSHEERMGEEARGDEVGGDEAEGEARLFLRGAVLLRLAEDAEAGDADTAGELDRPLAESALRAIERGDVSPWRTLIGWAGERGRRRLAAVTVAAAATAALVTLEALLLYGLIHAAGQLQGAFVAAAVIAAVLVVVFGTTALDLATSSGAQHLGRHLALRLRTAFLRKIPRLGDRFLASRLRSDMAERAHSVATLRSLPPHLADLVGVAAGMASTTLGLALVFPDSAALACLLAAVSLALPLLAQSSLREPAAALRDHGGGLSSFYFDSLRGLTAIRACGAETSLRRGHELVLDPWLENALTFNRRAALIEALQGLAGFGLAAAIVLLHTGRHGLEGGVLLLAYWALALPELGSAFAQSVRQLPNFAAVAGRFAEPLLAPEEVSLSERSGADLDREESDDRSDERSGASGVAISFDRVSAAAGGRTILHQVSAEILAGEKIAVLGASGAGKSTLLALLLGWQRPSEGRIRVDGAVIDVDGLRQRTAWVDPSVTLWNRSLLANLRYGTRHGPAVEALCRDADLRQVVVGLPAGLASELGEEGGRLSSGEAQRVRFGRALGRPDAELVLLDEPFRGLERPRRAALLERALETWSFSTMLCVTHDVDAAELFDRVAILEAGRLVELGAPDELKSRVDSHFSRLLAAEARRRRLWSRRRWKRWSMEQGKLEVGG